MLNFQNTTVFNYKKKNKIKNCKHSCVGMDLMKFIKIPLRLNLCNLKILIP